jgi:uncharacterized protein (DUF305 family)
VRTFRAVVHAVLAITIAPGCSGGGDAAPSPGPTAPVIVPGTPGGTNRTVTAVPTNTATADPEDIRFLQDMMIHHQQAVQMTEWARSRASNASVKALADRIRVGQKPEIDAMRVMLTDRGQTAPDLEHVAHTDHSGMPGMASQTDLAALERASGAAFDRMFLRLMIRHHEGAVTMGRSVLEKGADIRIGELAQDISVTETKEIQSMRKLQQEVA